MSAQRQLRQGRFARLMAENTEAHRHQWDRRGNLPAGSIRTCTSCGVRQVKQASPTGGLSWQQPAWLQSEGR